MARKPRNLRPDERELWNKATENTTRTLPERPEVSAAHPKPTPNLTPPKVANPRFRVGEAAKPRARPHDLAPSISQHVANHPVAMDRKAFGKMKRGRLAPEARIDLHGMTIAQAHPALLNFILNSVAMDRRLVLVITGKGKSKPHDGPMPMRYGVLRHQVPHWLHSMPLRPHILQIAEAHLKHGGQGAYYVYLRRARSQ
ncbi:Smr/MutS family protein [Aliiroseovarius subalbicans]|uniref:Smr/MutS family protein n=1 Tax=Aliiroseovarius subalbicans TaxID=2925840 RepID=UPI001F562107|nr:Smr/MutS family protein [Aliiroseovarius subalbicans]MCI2400078.1 Smr/MutS family protein [Aliiroseovarius subalbicans]